MRGALRRRLSSKCDFLLHGIHGKNIWVFRQLGFQPPGNVGFFPSALGPGPNLDDCFDDGSFVEMRECLRQVEFEFRGSHVFAEL